MDANNEKALLEHCGLVNQMEELFSQLHAFMVEAKVSEPIEDASTRCIGTENMGFAYLLPGKV